MEKFFASFLATLAILMTFGSGKIQADTMTFYSIDAEDGYAVESSETSNIGGAVNIFYTSNSSLRLGDNADKRQFKTIVSFDTSSIPNDATITSVVLRIKRGKLAGGINPFTTHGICYVDIKGGSGFSDNTTLQKQDFEAIADANQVATMSNPTANETWSEGVLNASGWSSVNKTGKTQLRVYFSLDDDDNATANFMGFYGGGTAGSMPELVVTYSIDDVFPAEPTGLNAIGGDSQVLLAWNENLEPDLKGYNVYRGTTNGGPYSKINGSLILAPTHDYLDENVINGTTYYYVVRAVDNADQESGDSNQAIAATEGVPTPVPQDAVDLVSQTSYTDYLYNKLYTHTGNNRNAMTSGTLSIPRPDHEAARDNLLDFFQSLELDEVYLDPIPDWVSGTKTWTGWENVVGVKLGIVHPETKYLVGGHYDSVNCPGADDNASGVAAVMEAARVLSQFQFEYTIIFIAWDAEDTKGHKGSHYDADTRYMAGEDIAGVVNMDMISYNSVGASYDKIWIHADTPNFGLRTDLATAFTTYTGLMPVLKGKSAGSDHDSYQAWYPAALIIEPYPTSNPNYHKTTDSVDMLNYIDYTFATQVTKAVVGYLAEHAVVIGY